MTQITPPTNTGRPGEVLPEDASGSRSFAWWGIVLLIATEGTLFAMLVASYFYLRFHAPPPWPPAGIDKPDLTLPLVMTVILWSSSVPVHLADRGIRNGRQDRLRFGLAAGFLLGCTFLALQVFVEYPETLGRFTPRTNAYGSLFFAITGFHGAHVAVGLAMSAWAQARAWAGAFTAERHVTVQTFALYWHFVDVVWLFVLYTVYVSPYV